MKITRGPVCLGTAVLLLAFGYPAQAQDDSERQGLGPVAYLEWREIGPAVVGGRVLCGTNLLLYFF